jgi:hypothetical protein
MSDARRNEGLQALASLPTIKSLHLQPVFRRPPYGTDHHPTSIQEIQGPLAAFRNLSSLTIAFQPFDIPEIVSHSVTFSPQNLPERTTDTVLALRELHLEGYLASLHHRQEETLDFLAAFDLSTIRRLTLSGGLLIELVLGQLGHELVSLRSLRLRVGLWPSSENVAAVISDFVSRRSLEELELDGFNCDLAIEYIVTRGLRKLRLHTWEFGQNRRLSSLRSAKEIRICSELAPHLEHIMIDVAQIGKLWHPTAIPGIDVDVQLYQVLDALSKFPRLKILHLFPRFYNLGENGAGSWNQALEDDGQAVQIFKHIRSIRPSLELLIISSDNVVTRFAEFEPMMWTVCQLGDSILLRVRQANKDYEQRQIWHGQRRLRMEIKRYFHHKPYLDEVGPRFRRGYRS